MRLKNKYSWEYCLRKIYGEIATVTIIKGEWKTGKTDLALYLTEELKRLGLITEAAGNVRCYSEFKSETDNTPSDKNIKYIDNFRALKMWLFTRFRKAFVFDEALKEAASKEAMTKLNRQWLKVVPELSKGKCHLFVLVQEESMLDKTFRHPTFRSAVWNKLWFPEGHPQHRKVAKLSAKALRGHVKFYNLPRTTIIFNPSLSATWRMNPETDSYKHLSLEFKVAMDYANGLSTDAIKRKYPEVKDRKEATRMLKKVLKTVLEKWQVAEDKRRVLSEGEMPQEP